jgi:hypothetical protein
MEKFTSNRSKKNKERDGKNQSQRVSFFTWPKLIPTVPLCAAKSSYSIRRISTSVGAERPPAVHFGCIYALVRIFLWGGGYKHFSASSKQHVKGGEAQSDDARG